MPKDRISHALRLAVEHHRGGRLQEAQNIYREILTVERENADALHLLGVVAHQTGRHRAAVDLIKRAIEQNPARSDFHSNLGAALLALGKLEDAISAFRRALGINPQHARAHNNLGLSLKDSGALDEAVASFHRALAIDPNFVEAHNNLAIVLQKQGKLGEALASFRRAVEIKSDYAEAHANLGAALHDHGERDEAVASYRRALRLDPNNAAAHNNLGNTLNAQGKSDEAIASYRRALEIEPKHMLACYNLGIALTARGELDEAIVSFRHGLTADPNHAEAHNALGIALRDQGKRAEALTCFRRAVRLAPNGSLFWRDLANELSNLKVLDDPDTLRRELIDCLSHSYVDHDRLAQTSLRLLKTYSGIKQLLRLARKGHEDALASRLQDGTALTALNDGLLLLLLEKVRLSDPTAERLLTEVRRYFLRVAVEQGASTIATQEAQDFLSALAHQCFINEYVYFQTTEETRWVEQLRRRVAVALGASDRVPNSQIALLASYVPLSAVPVSETLLDLIGTGCDVRFERLIIRQVREPREEEAIRRSELSASRVTDSTSRMVRSQYEENPFPRWTSLDFEEPGPMAWVLKGLFPHLLGTELASVKSPKILVAGCGTGRHAVSCAKRFLGAEVLAVDLSLTSLCYAIRKARELDINNVEFAHKDILELTHIDARFELIECVGVLHHLQDPVKGWRILVDLLKPLGFMKVGLYSERARRTEISARSFIAERGYEATKEGIRQCRQDILALPDDVTAKRISRSYDFYTMSTCRDLIFHVQEHRFTLPEIADILKDLGLEFLGFELRDTSVKRTYVEQFPQDPTAVDLRCWDQYEKARPQTFSGMYQFWVRKRPRETGDEPAAHPR